MLLKISLGLAILVGLATLYFTGPVKQKIDDLTASVASATAAQQAAEEGQRKANDEAKKSKAAYETASKELTAVTNILNDVSARLTAQEKRANTAAANLVTVTEDRNEARQKLNQWEVLGIPVDRVRESLENAKRLEGERTALQTENRTLLSKVNYLDARLKRYEGDPVEIPLPPGTRGKIVAVDAKYDFVVLDIGGNQGLVPEARMLVNRDGRLVAKVQITRVEPNRAIANIMPEWKQDDVIEGDQVVSLQ